jgi:hypothetical protein
VPLSSIVLVPVIFVVPFVFVDDYEKDDDNDKGNENEVLKRRPSLGPISPQRCLRVTHTVYGCYTPYLLENIR